MGTFLAWVGWPMTGLSVSLLLLACLVVGEWIAYRLAAREAQRRREERTRAWRLAQQETQRHLDAAKRTRVEWT